METQESPEPRSVPGSLFLLRSSLLIGSPALFSFALRSCADRRVANVSMGDEEPT
jgi:hypothetical protein